MCGKHLSQKQYHVQLLPVEAGAGAPLGHDGQVGLEDAADEGEDVVVAGRLEDGDLVAEGVRLVGRGVLHVEELDGDGAVVEEGGLVDDAEGAGAHLPAHVDGDLLEGDLPGVEGVAP